MFGKFTFPGGIHPLHTKNKTARKPVETLSPPERLFVPLQQHIGAPAKIAVKRGDAVKLGQVLADAGGFVSSPVHAPVSGKVVSVGMMPHPLGKQMTGVEIENDGLDERVDTEPALPSWRECAPGELVQKIAAAGIVGMGGASFPTHVKLSPPTDYPIDTLIINGAECEPYLTADHRLMLEKTEEMCTGVLIVKKILGARRTIIAVEDNKPDVLDVLGKKVSQPPYQDITLARCATKYPQGGEKQLIKALLRREVPSGGLPMHVGCVVQNVGTVFAIHETISRGVPLYQRIVTVTGPVVANPKNLLVRLGTPFHHLLSACDTDVSRMKKLIMGGPMMGIAQTGLDVPVVKSTSGLLATDTTTAGVREYDCINCGHCVKVCPIHLIPSFLAKYVDNGKFDDAAQWHIQDCIECGSCAYVCPSKINLVHFMKLGKYHITRRKKAETT